MIVCLCNALSDRAIRAAAANGATCCKGVWQRCGCRPDCGQCGSSIKDILAAHQNATCGHVPPSVPLAAARD